MSKYDGPFGERFARDFFKMPQITMSSQRPTGSEVQAYCKKHIGLIVVDGRLLMGVRDDFTNDFLPIRSVPGSLTAEHIKDKRPVRWWQLWRMWQRRSLADGGKP